MSNSQSRQSDGAPRMVAILRLARLMACGVGLLGSAGMALATPASGFNSSVVGPTVFGDLDVKMHAESLRIKFQTKGTADVYVVTNVVALGGHSGWHSHPGPSLVSVKSGTVTYYDGDDPTCTPHVVHAGEGFIDEGDGHVHIVRNEGSTVLELVAFQIIPVGAARRIDIPTSPGNCPF